MSQFPCPNPICTHAFSAQEVQRAGALKCPVCGQVFQFRTGAIPQAPSRPGVAKPAPVATPKSAPAPQRPAPAPPANLPVARPGTAAKIPDGVDVLVTAAPTVPSPPVARDPAFSAAVGDGPLVRPRWQRQKWSGKQLAFLGVGILAGIAVVLGVVIFIREQFAVEGTLTAKGRVTIGTALNLKNVQENAFKLILPDKAWTKDHEVRAKMGVIGVWKNTDRDNPVWFAVGVRDYGLYRPREAVLLQAGIEKLEQYFGDTLELEAKAEPAKLCDKDGQRLLFKGQINSVSWWGHVYMLAHHGFGYWLYVAAPSKAEAEEAFKELQEQDAGFMLFSERQGWREQPPKMDTFTTANGALTITLPEGIYEKHNAKDQDEQGELYLFGKYQKEKDNRKNGEVLVLALEKKGDLKEAIKYAREYLEAKKMEESKDYKIVAANEGADQELGTKGPVGNRPGRIAEYVLQRGEQPTRFMLVAVVNDADNLHVVRCDCTYESRQIWRQDFQEMLRTAKFKKEKVVED